MWRLVWAIPTWVAMLIIQIPLYILGWIIVPIAAACGAYKREFTEGSPDKWIYHFTWPFMALWDNWEDGIANDTYWKAPNMFLQIVYWSSYRNPINGLRTVPILSCKVHFNKIRFIGTKKSPLDFDRKPYEPEWFFCWQGLYSDYWRLFMWRGKLMRFWIGWKLYPSDMYPRDLGYRAKGASFAVQFKEAK